MAEFIQEPLGTDIIAGGNEIILFTNDVIDTTVSNTTGAITALDGSVGTQTAATFFAFVPVPDTLGFSDVSTVNPQTLTKSGLYTGTFRVNGLKASSHQNLQNLQSNINLRAIHKTCSGFYVFLENVQVLTITAIGEPDPAGRQDYEVSLQARAKELARPVTADATMETLAALNAISTDITYTGIPA